MSRTRGPKKKKSWQILVHVTESKLREVGEVYCRRLPSALVQSTYNEMTNSLYYFIVTVHENLFYCLCQQN